jgi:hypothetical protein
MDTACLKWKGTHRVDGRPIRGKLYVYQLAYEIKHGPLKRGLILHHRCKNVWCINPDHLEPMTQSQHMREHGFGGDAHVGQALKTHCPAGHPYDDENTYRYKGERHCRACRLESRRRHRKAAAEAAKEGKA